MNIDIILTPGIFQYTASINKPKYQYFLLFHKLRNNDVDGGKITEELFL